MKPKNLLRIKVNGFNLIKVSLINSIDFNFSYPRTNVAGQIVDSHFSLHTRNNKVTFKITSIIKNEREILPSILERASKDITLLKSIVPIGQLDLLKGVSFDLSNPNILTDIHIGIALNIKGKQIEDLFISKLSKNKDNSFSYVKNISIPKERGEFKCKCLVGINFCGKIDDYIKTVDDYCVIKETTKLGVEYTLLFLVKYQFPEVIPSKSALTV